MFSGAGRLYRTNGNKLEAPNQDFNNALQGIKILFSMTLSVLIKFTVYLSLSQSSYLRAFRDKTVGALHHTPVVHVLRGCRGRRCNGGPAG